MGVAGDISETRTAMGGGTRKRSSTATWGHSGQRGRHLGGHLRGCGHGRSGRPPWGETRGKGEGCWPAIFREWGSGRGTTRPP